MLVLKVWRQDVVAAPFLSSVERSGRGFIYRSKRLTP